MKNRLRTLRNRKRLTLSEVASNLNVKSDALSKYERGEREPALCTLFELAKFYNTTVEYIHCQSEEQVIYEKK